MMPLWIAIVYHILTVIIALISPFWGLVGLLATLFIRFQDRAVGFETFPSFILLSGAVFVGLLINKPANFPVPLKQDKTLLWFYLIGGFSTFIAALLESIGIMQTLGASMLVYYFSSRLVNTPNKFFVLYAISIAIATVLASEAITSFMTDPESPFRYGNDIEGYRLQGWARYANANEFGAILIIPLAYSFSLIFGIKSWIVRVGILAVSAILFQGMLLTLSRTCMATLGIMAIVTLVLWFGGNIIKKALIVGVASVICIGALSMVPGPVQDRFYSISDYENDASFQGRQRAWEQGWHMAKSHPIWGIGVLQWDRYHGRASHNTFIQILAETGFIGLGLFLMSIGYALYNGYQLLSDPRFQRGHPVRAIAVGTITALIGFLIYGFFGNQGYTPFVYMYIGLCTALVHLGKNSLSDSVTPEKKVNNGSGKKSFRRFHPGIRLSNRDQAR